jgi:hypothetical protein
MVITHLTTGAPASIMRADVVVCTNQHRQAKFWRKNNVESLFVVLSATAMLWMGMSELLNDVYRIPANEFFDAYDDQLQTSENDGRTIRKASRLYDQMPAWSLGNIELRRYASLVLMGCASISSNGGNDPLCASEGIRNALVASIKKAPVEPLSWALLADLELRLRDDRLLALQYLKQSYRVALVEPEHSLYRLNVAFRCADKWDKDVRRLLQKEMVVLFPEVGRNPNAAAFIEQIKSDTLVQDFFRTLLRGNDVALKQYEAALERAL